MALLFFQKTIFTPLYGLNLACWALIEDPISKKREVEGMVVSGKYIISMRECPNSDGYVYADSSNQALNRAVTDRRVPPNGSLPPERW